MQNMPIGIFRGDDTDAFSYQTIVGTIKTDLDLTGCKAVFRYLGFSMEFDPIPEDRKLTIVIPADETKKFPPGLGYASLRVYDSEGRLKTFSNRIMVFVATKTPMFGSDEFEVDFNVRASLEPLKFFVGPNPDDFDEYRGYVEKVIDRASAAKYGLAILLDAIDSDLGAANGVAATPVAVKAAYAAIIKKLTDDYYTAEQTDEAIDRVAAYYITYDAAGNPFQTRAALLNAQTYYSGGEVRTPTRNDYAIVLADETHDNAEYRYIYAVPEGQTTGSWQPQYPVEGIMTVDQDVVRGSQNPVSGGGVWSAIWGALSALPTGFSSLYDWVVAQLAGKASKADATLTPIYSDTPTYSEWTCKVDGRVVVPESITYDEAGAWTFDFGPEDAPIQIPGDEYSTELTKPIFGDSTFTATRTRTDILGYRLGPDEQTNPNRDKPLASEAEAEALRTGKLDKSGGTMTGGLTMDGGNLITFSDQSGTRRMTIGLYNDIFEIKLYSYDTLTYTWRTPFTSGVFALASELSYKLASSSAAPAFSSDSSTQYAVGSHVTYNGKLYVCTTATTGGTWVAGSWTADTVAMKAPNPTAGNLAALDASGNPTDSLIPAANVAVKGNIPYDRITITTGQLQDHAEQKVTLNAASTTLVLPALTNLSDKVSDFGIDMVNAYAPKVGGTPTPTAASFQLDGTLGTDYNLIVPDGETWSDMTALAPNEMAIYYFTLSAFQINDKLTWGVTKQVVKPVPVPVAP